MDTALFLDAYRRLVESLKAALPAWQGLDEDLQEEYVSSLQMLLALRDEALTEASGWMARAQMFTALAPLDAALRQHGDALAGILGVRIDALLPVASCSFDAATGYMPRYDAEPVLMAA